MSKTILIADDSPSMRMLIEFTLKDAGYSVITAPDGEEALARAKADDSDIDMIITDLNMPGMDGITLIRGLRAESRYRFTPICMLTTESQEALKQEGRMAGANGWIVKPFTPDQLIAVVRKFVRQDRMVGGIAR
jgi:two-component system chemotaxis response regulator CheY